MLFSSNSYSETNYANKFYNVISSPYSSDFTGENNFFSSSFHSDEINSLKTEKCKPLEFFLATQGNGHKKLDETSYLILITESGYSTLIRKPLTKREVFDNYIGLFLYESHRRGLSVRPSKKKRNNRWSSYGKRNDFKPPKKKRKNYGFFGWAKKNDFYWEHKCHDTKNVFTIKNKYWEKTSHIYLIFDFQNMAVNEERYSISNPNKLYETLKYHIVRYVKGPDLNKIPEYEIQKKMKSMDDLPNNLVRIKIYDNEKGELKKISFKSTIIREFKFGELNDKCMINGRMVPAGGDFARGGFADICGYHIVEEKKLSKNKLVAIKSASSYTQFYDFDFINDSGTYTYADNKKLLSFPFDILY